MTIKILLQTTIPTTADDWSIDRFSLLQDYLSSLTDDNGKPLCEVVGRDIASFNSGQLPTEHSCDRITNINGNDPVLSSLDDSDFDQLWLFALDVGDGLSQEDIAGINRFRYRGGGILSTRDHQDMGCSMCGIIDIGDTHYFHSQNPDPDASRLIRDDPYTTYINYPNYHSGANGDYQKITVTEPIHALMKNPNSPSGKIEFFPAHPHEGGIGIPANNSHAKVIATSKSIVTQREFNLIVAQESYRDSQGNILGRAIANSSFHHLVDYNWDISQGCPSFVDEPPGKGMSENPQALNDIQAYVKNATLWLANKEL